MTTKDTVYIKYENGKRTAWLPSTDIDTSVYKDIVFQETRQMLVAEEGMALYNGDEYVGEAIWLDGSVSADCFVEKEFTGPDLPEFPEDEPEELDEPEEIDEVEFIEEEEQ